jgi:hypothetical protein
MATKALALGLQQKKNYYTKRLYIHTKNLKYIQKKTSYNKICFKPRLILKIIEPTLHIIITLKETNDES